MTTRSRQAAKDACRRCTRGPGEAMPLASKEEPAALLGEPPSALARGIYRCALARRGRRRGGGAIGRRCRQALGRRVHQIHPLAGPALDHQPGSAGPSVRCADVPSPSRKNDFVLAVASDGGSYCVARRGEEEFQLAGQVAVGRAPRTDAPDEDRGVIVGWGRQRSISGAARDSQQAGCQHC
jgi:hypothetical protein